MRARAYKALHRPIGTGPGAPMRARAYRALHWPRGTGPGTPMRARAYRALHRPIGTVVLAHPCGHGTTWALNRPIGTGPDTITTGTEPATPVLMGITPTSKGPGTGLWPTYRHLAMAHLPTLHGLGTGPTAIGLLHNYTV
jgi:hypothetical protein